MATRTSKVVGETGSITIGYSRSGRQNACYWRVEQIRGSLGFCGSGPAGKASAIKLALRCDRLLAFWRKAS